MRPKQQGLSLIELMIALGLGLLVTATIIEIFLNAQQLYRSQTAKARLQENGRYALYFMGQHIMSAGYSGCSNGAQSPRNNALPGSRKTEYQWRFEQPIFGMNDSTPPADSTLNNWLRGDILTLRGIDGNTIDITSAGSSLSLRSHHGLEPGRLILVSNCLFVSLFQITSINGTKVTLNTPIPEEITAYPFGNVTPVSSKSFFIRRNADNIPSLYWKNSNNYDNYNANQATEIIDHVIDLQIMYGIDIDADGRVDSYVNASSGLISNDWMNVVSVRIQLLLKSEENNVTTSPQQYFFDADSDGIDEKITATDHHLYHVVTQIFTLRNRVR